MKKQLIFSDEQKRTCAIGAKANLDYKRMLYNKNNSPQNAKVGKNYPEWGGMPAAQARAIYRKDYLFNMHSLYSQIKLAGLSAKKFYEDIQEAGRLSVEKLDAASMDAFVKSMTGPIDLCGLKAEQCPGAHDCMPAGRRSRTEWCNCGKIIE